MKKSTLIEISLLSVFILCSLSYQPIIADRQIDNIPIVDDTKTTDDCGCNSNNSYPTLVCTMLKMTIYLLNAFIMIVILPLQLGLSIIADLFDIIDIILVNLYYSIGCPPF